MATENKLIPVPTGATGDSTSKVLESIQSVIDSDYPVQPNMPALGARVLLSAIFGLMCHPEKGDAKNNIDVGQLTPVTFDWWHANMWRAGRVKLGEI